MNVNWIRVVYAVLQTASWFVNQTLSIYTFVNLSNIFFYAGKYSMYPL